MDVTRDSAEVYYWFVGAALCDILKERYIQIKTCPAHCKDIVLQETTVFQAVNTKEKSSIPGYAILW